MGALNFLTKGLNLRELFYFILLFATLCAQEAFSDDLPVLQIKSFSSDSACASSEQSASLKKVLEADLQANGFSSDSLRDSVTIDIRFADIKELGQCFASMSNGKDSIRTELFEVSSNSMKWMDVIHKITESFVKLYQNPTSENETKDSIPLVLNPENTLDTCIDSASIRCDSLGVHCDTSAACSDSIKIRCDSLGVHCDTSAACSDSSVVRCDSALVQIEAQEKFDYCVGAGVFLPEKTIDCPKVEKEKMEKLDTLWADSVFAFQPRMVKFDFHKAQEDTRECLQKQVLSFDSDLIELGRVDIQDSALDSVKDIILEEFLHAALRADYSVLRVPLDSTRHSGVVLNFSVTQNEDEAVLEASLVWPDGRIEKALSKMDTDEQGWANQLARAAARDLFGEHSASEETPEVTPLWIRFSVSVAFLALSLFALVSVR